MKQQKLLFLIFTLTFLLIPTVLAAPDLSITSLKDTLYLTGGEIIIDEPTQRDIIVAAGSVAIMAPVQGDIIITSGSTEILAPITGDLTIASGKTTISSDISGILDISSGATTITSQATIAKKASISGESLVIEGTIKEDVDVNVEELTIAESAILEKNLVTNVLPKDTTAIKGDLILSTDITTYQQIISQIKQTAWHALILYAIGVLALFIFGSYTESVTQKMANNPILSFASGILFFICIPLIIFLLILTVVGVPIALFISGAVLLTIFLSVAFTSLTLGHIVLYKLLSIKVSSFIEMLLGVVLFTILIKLPIVGPILAVYAVCAGMGAAILSLVWFSKKKGKTKQYKI